MPQVTSRQELIDYCLRKLGTPIIEINVDMDQVEDRINDAIEFYVDYHFDGTEQTYFAYQITAQDVTNRYIAIPDEIVFVSRVLSFSRFNIHPMNDPSLSWRNGNPFNMLNDTVSSGAFTSSTNDHAANSGRFQLKDFFMVSQKFAEIENILGTHYTPIRFNRRTNRLYIDVNWETLLQEGVWIVIEGLTALDPEQYIEVYNDRWLKMYATALIKRQWGANLIKFSGISLPGGVNLDGDKLYDQAQQEIDKLEEEMTMKYMIPPVPFIA